MEHTYGKFETPKTHMEAYAYDATLTPITHPEPLLPNNTFYFAPIDEDRYQAHPLINDSEGDLEVRGWRYSYNARGVIEVLCQLKAAETVLIVCNPLAIDEPDGVMTPHPQGSLFLGTPEMNAIYHKHAKEILSPFIQKIRPSLKMILYTIPGPVDSLRSSAYTTIDRYFSPGDPKKAQMARNALKHLCQSYAKTGSTIPSIILIDDSKPVSDYFRQVPGIMTDDSFNGGLTLSSTIIPISKDFDVRQEDMVVFNAEGSEELKIFLSSLGVKNILLSGYFTTNCVDNYRALKDNFNVWLVGDSILEPFPAQTSPNASTSDSLAKASIECLVTQTSWISPKAKLKKHLTPPKKNLK